jgi:hypothetical protein
MLLKPKKRKEKSLDDVLIHFSMMSVCIFDGSINKIIDTLYKNAIAIA